MGIKTRTELKQDFDSGSIPTAEMYANLIDSMLNKFDDDFYGKWRAGAQYYPGDVVIYQNSLYRVKLDRGSSGSQPAKGKPQNIEPVCSSSSPP